MQRSHSPRATAEYFSGLGRKRRDLSSSGVADFAVVPAITEINQQSNDQPGNQASPIDPSELVHHVAVADDSQDRHEREPGRTEGSRLPWIGAPNNHHRDAHDAKGKQRPYVHHSSDIFNRCNAANDRRQKSNENRVFVRRAKTGVYGGKELFGK